MKTLHSKSYLFCAQCLQILQLNLSWEIDNKQKCPLLTVWCEKYSVCHSNLVSSPITSLKLSCQGQGQAARLWRALFSLYFWPCWDMPTTSSTCCHTVCQPSPWWPCPQGPVSSPLFVPFLTLKTKFQVDTAAGVFHSALQLSRLKTMSTISFPSNNHSRSYTPVMMQVAAILSTLKITNGGPEN